MSNIDVFSLAEYCLNFVEQKHSEIACAEVFFSKDKYLNIEIEENSIKNSEIGEDNGFSIRVIKKNGSLGFAYANKMEKKTLEKICKIAI